MYLLGFDIGSSSIKAALVDSESGDVLKVVQHPPVELEIISHHPGWAEQDPELWWQSLCTATLLLLKETGVEPNSIGGIGIAYQMHGLVLVDKDLQVLRHSIIWCDSRAVGIGNEAFENLGHEKCLGHLLNSPGNFTASKLKWVQDNEPEIYDRIYKVLLPGDYISMRLTGVANTTVSGLSEGIFWDFKENQIADFILDYYQISKSIIPEIVETFAVHGKLTKRAALATGLAEGTVVSYRAGDQPNNAMSLGVLNPGEVAATGGTSGVVYGILDEIKVDPLSRINGFAHVNHSSLDPRIGLLLCINGAGIQYAWLKNQMAKPGRSYNEMEKMASSVAIGADGLRIIPFGNGSERILENRNPGAQINNLQFNRHGQAHFFRASLEGIAFSFVYGFQLLKELGLNPEVIKVGNDNLFRSEIFSTTIANLLNCPIEQIETTGAVGAAKASGIGINVFDSLEQALGSNRVEKRIYPENKNGAVQAAFQSWKRDLDRLLS